MVHCFRGMGMAVRAEGYCWVMEQLGEKQDFESELSRLGYLHENFALTVRRARSDNLGDEWTANYFVCVRQVRTSRSMSIWADRVRIGLNSSRRTWPRVCLVRPKLFVRQRTPPSGAWKLSGRAGQLSI